MKEKKSNEEKMDNIIEILLKEPRLSYKQALETIGSNNMASIHDIAGIKKFFHDIGKSDILEHSEGILYMAKKLKLKPFEIDGLKASIFSHTENPDPRYLWTGEYMGIAPKGHPAEGKLVLARINSIDMTKNTPHPLGILGGGSRKGQIVLSDTEFAVCDDLIKFRRANHPAYPWEGEMDCGYITGFEERNNLMIPITDGSKAIWCYDSKKDTQGYGTLYINSGVLRPMSCRPCSWNPGLVFNNNSSIDAEFKVLHKETLENVLKGEK